MSDLKLVAPDQPTPLEKLLMDAVNHEQPSADQRARVRHALGLAPIVAAPAALKPALKPSWHALAKVAAGGAVVAGAVAAVLFFRAPHAPVPLTVSAPVVAAAPLAPQAAPVVAAPAATDTQPAPPVIQADELAQEPLVADKAPAAVRSASARQDDPDLAGQILLIEQARKAIASGNAVGASQALDSYAVQYPRGSFGQEASVLRIEAIDLRGDHAQATQLARAFLARYPKSPHVSIMQRIAGR